MPQRVRCWPDDLTTDGQHIETPNGVRAGREFSGVECDDEGGCVAVTELRGCGPGQGGNGMESGDPAASADAVGLANRVSIARSSCATDTWELVSGMAR
jgi:hypothetical protein